MDLNDIAHHALTDALLASAWTVRYAYAVGYCDCGHFNLGAADFGFLFQLQSSIGVWFARSVADETTNSGPKNQATDALGVDLCEGYNAHGAFPKR